MVKKNLGPCSVVNCSYKDVSFRIITEFAYQKCKEGNMLEVYPYLEVGNQLCHPHYCKIVESNRNKRKLKSKEQDCSRKKIREEESIEKGNFNK